MGTGTGSLQGPSRSQPLNRPTVDVGRGVRALGGATAVLGVAASWFLGPYGWRKLRERDLAQACTRGRLLALTYDDGPSHSLTGRVLDLLDRHGATATFFVVGRNAQRRPDIVTREVDAGHLVGSHTENHLNAWKVDPVTASRDCAAGVDVVAGLGGDGRLFRPPQGKVTLAGAAQAAAAGLRLGWWTIDSQDSWARRPADEVVEEVDALSGGIVLMHDSHDFCTDDACVSDESHAEYVLDLTRRLLDLAERRSLTVVTVDDVG